MRDTKILIAPEGSTHHGLPLERATVGAPVGSYLADPIRKKSGKSTNRIKPRRKTIN
jgi:hypothetical protein